MVKPARLPTLSDHIRRCELFGVPEEAARIRFREFWKARCARDRCLSRTGCRGLQYPVPCANPFHRRRRCALRDRRGAPARTRSVAAAVAALHGMRGVGKTTLAGGSFAERHRGDYRATWWIRAHTEAGMRADLVALGVRLRWVEADDKEEPALAP